MEPAPDFETLSNDDLAREILELTEQEDRISYERRLLQGKLDILRAEQTERRRHGSLKPVQVDRLADVLVRKPPPTG